MATEYNSENSQLNDSSRNDINNMNNTIGTENYVNDVNEENEISNTINFIIDESNIEIENIIKEPIKLLFLRNQIKINERIYSTRVTKRPSPDILKTINEVILEHINQKERNELYSPHLIDINNFVYAAAISVNQYLGQLTEKKQKFDEKKSEYPKWITNIQTSIDKMRRTMGHILTILDCKQTNQYTMKQLRIKDRLKKKFGNLKIKTLNYHICAY